MPHRELVGEDITASQVRVICFGVHRAGGADPGLLFRGQLDADLAGDRLGHFALEAENSVEGTLVGFAPDVAVVGAIEQLHGDADLVVFADDGALEDAVDTQFMGDLGQVFLCALVLHDGGMGDDAEGLDAGKLGDEFFGHAVGEEVLGGVSGEVLQGENGDGAYGLSCAGAVEMVPSKPGGEGDRATGE